MIAQTNTLTRDEIYEVLALNPDAATSPEERAEIKYLQAAAQIQLYEQKGEAEFGKMFLNGRDYLKRNVRAQRNWLVKDLIPSGYLVILGATSKSGKTCLATALGVAVATGQKFLDHQAYSGAVLWCAYEESEIERAETLRLWPDLPSRFYVTHKRPLIDTEDGLRALEYWIHRTEAKLLVIDPLYGATETETLADGRAARRALSGLKDLCRDTGVTALVIHHFTKDSRLGFTRERFADSHQILATAGMDILMDAKDHPAGGRLIRLSCRGRGEFANRSLLVHSKDATHYEWLDDAGNPRPEPTPEERIVARLGECIFPLTAAMLAEDLEMPLPTLRNRLTDLIKTGQVIRCGKFQGAAQYRSANPSSSLPVI